MSDRIDSLLIQTPEGCSFALPLAGPITRFLAWAIDLVCTLVIFFVLSIVFSIFAVVSRNLADAVMVLAFFIVWMGYGMFFEWIWRGRTIGKRALGLRVIDEHGLRLTFNQIFMRNLLRLADSLPAMYLLGGIVCILTSRSQRLGDLVAGTVVVRTGMVFQPDLDKLPGDKFNSFRQYPHIEARLRQRVWPEEARVAVLALLRRDSLDSVSRLSLFAEIAEHFRKIVEFPQAATDGLSDEQYIRNVVDTIFRPTGGNK